MNRRMVLYILQIIIVGLSLFSCKYYKYKSIPNEQLSEIIKSKSRYSPTTNHYIIHFEDGKLELIDVALDSDKRTVSGKLVPFEGLQREYYDKIQLGKSRRRASNHGHLKAIKQTHFYLNERKGSGELNSFNFMFKDVIKIEVIENDIDKSFAVALGCTLLIVVSISGIMAVFLPIGL